MSNQSITTQSDIREKFLNQEAITKMITIANEFHKAQCFGNDVKNAHQAFTKIQAGYEMGMPPMESMNSLYIVNGKITIFGAALSKRLRQFGWKIEWPHSDEKSCRAVISKGDEKYEYEATAAEVEKLGSQAFKKAPKDKLRWHALSRLVRFSVPEVLGSISYTTEEVQGSSINAVEAEIVDPKKESESEVLSSVQAKIEAITTREEYEAMKEEIRKTAEKLTNGNRDALFTLCKEKLAKLNDAPSAPEQPAQEPAQESESVQSDQMTIK